MIRVENLFNWKDNNGKIAIFCAGQNGYTFYKILKLFNIEVDCFIDNDSQKWNTNVYDDVICYSPEMLSEKEEYLTFICISYQYYGEILEQAKKYKLVHLENMNEIIKDIVRNYHEIYKKLILELPYGKISEVFYDYNLNLDSKILRRSINSNEKIVVYTSVFGDYDFVIEPKYVSTSIEYFIISDNEPGLLDGYKWLDAKHIIPKEITSPILRNRYIKMHPHIIFPEYKYSIYVDGNVQILKDISIFIQKSKSGISVFRHPYRDDIFIEALAVANAKRADAEKVYNQMCRYMESQMPFGYGLPEMRIIAREHHNISCVKIMEEWWKEFINSKSQRDQLSFMYVMWKNGFDLSDLFLLGKDMRKCDFVRISNHKKETSL